MGGSPALSGTCASPTPRCGSCRRPRRSPRASAWSPRPTSTGGASRAASSARRCGRTASGSRARRSDRRPRRPLPERLLEQEDRVDRERDREADRPAVEVALDERAAAERALAGADAEGAREARVLPRVHEHEEDEDDRDDDLQDGEDQLHALKCSGARSGLTRWNAAQTFLPPACNALAGPQTVGPWHAP